MRKLLPALAVAAATLAACQSATEPEPRPDTAILKEDFEGQDFPPRGWSMTDPNEDPLFRAYRAAEGRNHYAAFEVTPGILEIDAFFISPGLRPRDDYRVVASFRYKRGATQQGGYAYARIFQYNGTATKNYDLFFVKDWKTVRLTLEPQPSRDAFLLFGLESAEYADVALDIDDVKVELELMER